MNEVCTERQDLDRLEGIIRTNLQGFVAVGKALTEIRERKLYQDEFKTFAEYCRARWDMSKTHANRLIGSSAIAEVLAPMGVVPHNERQIRPLALLETPELQLKAWELAEESASNGNVTARIVDQAVKKVKGNGGDDEKCPDHQEESRHLDLLKKHWREATPSDRDKFRKWMRESEPTLDADLVDHPCVVCKCHESRCFSSQDTETADVDEVGMRAA